MTEVELIKKMETCLENGKECDDKKCRDVLIRDALCIIKMQKERLEALVKTLGEQQAQIDGLNGLLAKNYTDERLVAVLNEIIDTVRDEDGCLEDDIDVLQTAMCELSLDGYVKVGKLDKTPHIVLNK